MALDVLTWLGLILVSYLIGGISTAYLATYLLTGRDIRRLGDRNSGAANVFRNVGSGAGLLVGAVDIVKGAIAVLLVWGLTDSIALQMAAGAAVLAGHNWPAHLGFRGGRGAATAIGVLMATVPIIALPVAAFALAGLYLSKRALIGLGMVLILVPILAWPAGYPYWKAIYAGAISLMVGITHVVSVGGFSIRSLVPNDHLDREQSDERALRQG